jgi:hypothetical protein
MKIIILLLSMLFCHIVDDYYLQGWLASAKQKSWWEKNAPNPLYKNDYIMALCEHAFSWTFMIHVPIVVYSFVYGLSLDVYVFCLFFAFNWGIHAITDYMKANELKINLIQDQLIHIGQIILTWVFYMNFGLIDII